MVEDVIHNGPGTYLNRLHNGFVMILKFLTIKCGIYPFPSPSSSPFHFPPAAFLPFLPASEQVVSCSYTLSPVPCGTDENAQLYGPTCANICVSDGANIAIRKSLARNLYLQIPLLHRPMQNALIGSRASRAILHHLLLLKRKSDVRVCLS